jgi:meiotically up-regulated gene 157 (Mug157) protein
MSYPAFLTPANAMLSVELTHLATMLESVGKAQNVSQAARKYSSTIKKAIWDTTVVNNIFAYETNGNNTSASNYLLFTEW